MWIPLIDHILLIGTFTSNLNNVVWSLVHEMRISLVFPIIMFILVKVNLKDGIRFAILLSIISIILSYYSDVPFSGTEIYYSIHCTSLFIVGALLAKNKEKILKRFSKFSTKQKIPLFLSGMILYLYAHPSFVINMLIPDFNPYFRAVIDTWVTSLGASILIVFAISPGLFSKLLNNRFVNYIGKTSYSLYLTHLAVLFTCIHFLNNVIPMWGICLVVILGTLILSSIMYHLVEKPAIKVGKYFAKPVTKKKIDENSLTSVKSS